MVDKISVEIELEGGDDVRKTLEEIVGGVDGLKTAAEELGKTDATVDVKAEGADETKTSIDEVKVAAEELGKVDATVKVGVEGADEAKASLDGVAGSAGEAKGLLDPLSQTASIIGVGFDGLSLAATRATATLDTLGTAAVRMGAKMTRSLGPLGILARSLGPIGIAVGVVAGALLKFGDSSADALNKLTASSASLDLTAQNFDKLQKALLQAGISSDAILPGLQKLKQTLSEDFFPTDVVTGLQRFIAQLERMPDGAERTNLAMQKLGDTLGAQVIAGLQTGTISAQNFATALGLITPATQQQIVEAAKYQQTLNQLSNTWNEFKATVAAPLATPIFQALIAEVKNLQSGFNGLKGAFQELKGLLTQEFSITSLKTAGNDVLALGNALKSLTISGKVSQILQSIFGDAKKATQAVEETGQAAATTGQQLQLVRNPFTGMAEVIRATDQALQQTGQSAQQAGQAGAQGAQQATQGYTSYEEILKRIQAQNQQLASTPPPPAPDVSGWQTLKQAVIDAGTAVGEFVAKLATITWDAISSLGVQAWNALTGAIQSAINKLLQFLGLRGDAGKVVPTGSGAIEGKARGGLLGGRGTGTSDSNLAWLSRGEYIMPASAVRQPGVLSLLEALRRSGRIPGFADGGLTSLIEGSGFDPAEFTREIKKSLEGVMAQIAAALMDMASEIDALSFARGGLLGGRGTGTSDSNLAWLSRGEHIMPARAVAQPGVLAFLEALRRSGGNLSRVLDGMGRFALGGMVPRVMPAFASGGLAGGMSNVTIQFPGLPAIGGLRASSGVVDELRKAAVQAQVRSGGRKPSRYS